MNKSDSLSKSLTYRIMMVVLVMMVVVTCVVYFHVRKYMLDEAGERYYGILLNDHEDIRRHDSEVWSAACNNVAFIERDISSPEKMISHVERIVSLNDRVASCCLLFVPDYYPAIGRFFVPYAMRDSANVIHSGRIDSIYHSYSERDWYRRIIESGKGEWGDPYYEFSLGEGFPQSHRMLVSYMTPVHDANGRTVALLCCDMSLESLQKKLMNDAHTVNEKYEKGQNRQSYSVAVDKHGVYIMHPDKKRELKDRMEVSSQFKGKSGCLQAEIDGVRSCVYYRRVKHLEWTFVLVVPEESLSRNGRVLNTIILVTVLIGLLVLYVVCQRTIRRITKPLHRFAISADEVAKGNFSSPLPDVQSNDEVRTLHDAFENMQKSLSIYVDELQKTTSEKASIEQELKIASGIQMALLPKTFPPFPDRSDIDLYATITPAREVGGDLYDYFLYEDRLVFCIGDVSGKGVPAALLMAVMRAMFRSEARRNHSAVELVETMNHNLSYEYTADYFVTMFVGIIDLKTGHLDYCNAGNEFPLISGTPLTMKPNLPVGALAEWNYVGGKTTLQSGDTIFLFTDGLSEAQNAEGMQFGRKHIREVVGSHPDCTPRQLAEAVETEVRLFAGDTEQNDDLTLLIIKWEKPETSR